MHRKEISGLKKKAATAYNAGKKKDAYEMWQKADKERKILQAKKMETKA